MGPRLGIKQVTPDTHCTKYVKHKWETGIYQQALNLQSGLQGSYIVSGIKHYSTFTQEKQIYFIATTDCIPYEGTDGVIFRWGVAYVTTLSGLT